MVNSFVFVSDNYNWCAITYCKLTLLLLVKMAIIAIFIYSHAIRATEVFNDIIYYILVPFTIKCSLFLEEGSCN